MKKILILFLFFSGLALNSYSQNTVTGIIRDSDNNTTLVGATIIIKGTTTGVTADVNGKFSLKVPANSTLVVSFLGYKTKEISYTGQTTIDVSLVGDFSAIDEVVVVAYGSQKKSHLTGSVASLKAEKLDEVPVSRVDQALQGKMSGVQINNSNPEAGAAPQIRVRGMGSISANNDPLIVVDGFPVPDGLSMVSMGDVESIEVLKDASSAALYGSRAAGGVILITTKSGNISKPKFNFKMYSGVKTNLKLPDITTTSEYIALLYKEADMRKLDPAVDGTTATMLFNKITDTEKALYLVENTLMDQPTDWIGEAMNKYGTVKSYQLSASEGDKGIKYFISGNYNSEDAIMKYSSYDKYSFRAKLDAKLSKYISVGVNFSPTYSKTQSSGNGLINDTMGLLKNSDRNN